MKVGTLRLIFNYNVVIFIFSAGRSRTGACADTFWNFPIFPIFEKNSSFIIELQSTSVSGAKKYYSKSWGGLSGGAISGIVIACVIALAVVSIAAITLKTSSTKSDGITHYKLTKYDNSFQE